MSNYFSGDIIKEPFAVFSSVHIATLCILAFLNILLILWLKKAAGETAILRFRYILGGFLLFNELFYVLWSVGSGSWSLDYSLPLQLCDAAAFLAAFMLFKSHYSSFEIVYFLGLGGSLQALITPDLAYPFPHCIYFSFFLGHGAILTAISYMLLIQKYRPTLKSIGKTWIVTNLYMGLIAVVNTATGGNYMFLCRKPESASLMDALGPWPWYILSLEAVGMVIFFLCYLPFGIRRLLQKPPTSEEPCCQQS